MEHRRAFITMTDGTRLAAQLWLPEQLPAPVVLEALPYRMDDLTSSYTAEYERLCREGGLAVCRLDIRVPARRAASPPTSTRPRSTTTSAR